MKRRSGFREVTVMHTSQLRQHTLKIAVLVHQRAKQGLVTRLGSAVGAFDTRNLENNRPAMSFKLGQHVIHEVAVENLAIDVFPA